MYLTMLLGLYSKNTSDLSYEYVAFNNSFGIFAMTHFLVESIYFNSSV